MAWQFRRKQRIVRSVRVSVFVLWVFICTNRLVGVSGVRVLCVSGGDRKYANWHLTRIDKCWCALCLLISTEDRRVEIRLNRENTSETLYCRFYPVRSEGGEHRSSKKWGNSAEAQCCWRHVCLPRLQVSSVSLPLFFFAFSRKSKPMAGFKILTVTYVFVT